MYSKRKQQVRPGAGQQERNSYQISAQKSIAAPEPTVRRSKRLRGEPPVEGSGSSLNEPVSTENPSITTEKIRLARPKLRKSNSGRIDHSTTREVDTPRGKDSVVVPNLQEKNRATGERTRKITPQEHTETATPPVSREIADMDPEELRLSARLGSWLEEVRVSPVAGFDPFFTDWRGPDSIDMARSISISTDSLATSEPQSTVKPVRKKIKKVTLAEGLRTRRVWFEGRAEDPKRAELKNVIVTDTRPILSEQTELLRNKIQSFLSKADEFQRGTSIYNTVEKLSDDLNDWKSIAHMATISNRDFNKDLERCNMNDANEALFQRTIMMSIFNRHQISDKFDYNCEGQWFAQGNSYPLPSTEENIIPAPKPDLAIFIRFESLVGWGPYWRSIAIPDELKPCMAPDGSINRCFPFIFIEAKKGKNDPTPALMANMHSASQALLNIYVWMNEAGQTDKFFNDVRLFSIVINAEEFALRVHRAELTKEGEGRGLEFYYDDICKKHEYERDNICNIIRNILVEYVEGTLLKILKESVMEILQNQGQGQKRKSEVIELVAGDRRSKKTAVGVSSEVIEPSRSFGMS
ncbi:hypothetical protein GGR51DRAFT_403273 [Nemania sp. FL0031]|nr:hypothetical protein GGR51DRAFT_403273 [Nemania sp. FL0031]